MTIGAYLCCRNGITGDYCLELAKDSLLPVVDELILCDSDSTDGAREMMERWADKEKRIRVINYPWPDPKGDSLWWVKWLNFARQHLTTEMQLTIDADEVLSEDGGRIIRQLGTATCATFDRLNFWRDPWSIIPDGQCCGKWVTRFGPAQYHMPSDEPHHPGELPILDNARRYPQVKIFHLGFLRRTDAFYRKARVVLPAFFNRYDDRLEKSEAEGKALWESECEFTHQLQPYRGPWPDGVRKWLWQRGWSV